MGGSVVILNRAKAQKNDEFYTPQAVINNELIHYKDHFKDKVVYCNCDDPEWSEFYKFFKLRMALYGIKNSLALTMFYLILLVLLTSWYVSLMKTEKL